MTIINRSSDHGPDYELFATEAEDRIYRAYNLLMKDSPEGTANARSITQEWYVEPTQYVQAWKALLLTAGDHLAEQSIKETNDDHE
jgi:hypothetical protein